MKRTTEWECSVCGKKAIVVSSIDNNGTGLPHKWHAGWLSFLPNGFKQYPCNAEILLCETCNENIETAYPAKPETTKVFKAPFYQRFFGAAK